VGLPPARPLLELSSTTAIKASVADGVAPAVLSSLAVSGELAGHVLIAVPVIQLDLRRTLRLVHPAGRMLAGPAKELAGIARSRHRR
jgi:DNA-binding transcriptional LysR family regulator